MESANELNPEVTVKIKTNLFSSANGKCQRSGPVIIIPRCWLPLQFPPGQRTTLLSWGLSLTPEGQTGALKRNSGSTIIAMGTLVSPEMFCVGLSGKLAVRFVSDPSERHKVCLSNADRAADDFNWAESCEGPQNDIDSRYWKRC